MLILVNKQPPDYQAFPGFNSAVCEKISCRVLVFVQTYTRNISIYSQPFCEYPQWFLRSSWYKELRRVE